MEDEMIDGQTATSVEPDTLINETNDTEILGDDQAPSEPQDLSGQQAIEQNPEAEVLDWTKDERHDKRWGKDINKLYASYRNLEGIHESKYKPMEIAHNDVLSKFKDNGMDIADIDSYFSEFKELTDPENPIVAQNKIIQELMQHPEHSQILQRAFNDISERVKQSKYPGMTEDQIRKTEERDQEHYALKERVEAFESQQKAREDTEIAYQQLDEISKMASEIGFSFNPEERQGFINKQIQNEVHVKNWYYEFMRENREALNKARGDFYEGRTIKILNKNKQSVPSPGNINSQSKVEVQGKDARLLEKVKGLKKTF